MVRLIELGYTPEHENLPFQFHDGTIDRAIFKITSGQSKNFNSTMVRLIENSHGGVNVFIKFQFHDGTIDRKRSWPH